MSASTLWRSEDYAKTFTKQSSKFDSNATLDNFAISDTDHTKVVIGDSVSGVVYVTNDEGATYTRVSVGQNFYSFDFYPGSNDVMVGYNQEMKSIWGSVNGGLSWFKMVQQVEQYEIGEKGNDLSNLNTVFVRLIAAKRMLDCLLPLRMIVDSKILPRFIY